MVLYIKGLKGLGARRSFPVENFVEYRISLGPDAPPPPPVLLDLRV